MHIAWTRHLILDNTGSSSPGAGPTSRTPSPVEEGLEGPATAAEERDNYHRDAYENARNHASGPPASPLTRTNPCAASSYPLLSPDACLPPARVLSCLSILSCLFTFTLYTAVMSFHILLPFGLLVFEPAGCSTTPARGPRAVPPTPLPVEISPRGGGKKKPRPASGEFVKSVKISAFQYSPCYH